MLIYDLRITIYDFADKMQKDLRLTIAWYCHILASLRELKVRKPERTCDTERGAL